VRVSLRAVPGVDSVDVSLAKGLASVKMKPGNAATLKQLQNAITKNGFAMKDSATVIAGTVLSSGSGARLQVSGSNELLTLTAENNSCPEAAAFNGKSVVVQGTVAEASKGKLPILLRYRSIVELQK
jgi:hypothetical protein